MKLSCTIAVALLCGLTATGEYTTATNARTDNAVIVIVQDGCPPCKKQIKDLISVLADTGFLYDSQIIVVSYEKEPKLASALMGENKLTTPHTIVFRGISGTRYGFRYFGYQSKKHFSHWMKGVRQWQPSIRGTP